MFTGQLLVQQKDNFQILRQQQHIFHLLVGVDADLLQFPHELIQDQSLKITSRDQLTGTDFGQISLVVQVGPDPFRITAATLDHLIGEHFRGQHVPVILYYFRTLHN